MEQERSQNAIRFARSIWFVFYVLEGILLFRFLLKLINANPAAGFTNLIYNVSQPFVSPFLYVVRSPNIYGNIFEWSTLLALLVYWFVAWALIRLIFIYLPSRGVRERADVHDHGEK